MGNRCCRPFASCLKRKHGSDAAQSTGLVEITTEEAATRGLTPMTNPVPDAVIDVQSEVNVLPSNSLPVRRDTEPTVDADPSSEHSPERRHSDAPSAAIIGESSASGSGSGVGSNMQRFSVTRGSNPMRASSPSRTSSSSSAAPPSTGRPPSLGRPISTSRAPSVESAVLPAALGVGAPSASGPNTPPSSTRFCDKSSDSSAASHTSVSSRGPLTTNVLRAIAASAQKSRERDDSSNSARSTPIPRRLDLSDKENRAPTPEVVAEKSVLRALSVEKIAARAPSVEVAVRAPSVDIAVRATSIEKSAVPVPSLEPQPWPAPPDSPEVLRAASTSSGSSSSFMSALGGRSPLAGRNPEALQEEETPTPVVVAATGSSTSSTSTTTEQTEETDSSLLTPSEVVSQTVTRSALNSQSGTTTQTSADTTIVDSSQSYATTRASDYTRSRVNSMQTSGTSQTSTTRKSSSSDSN